MTKLELILNDYDSSKKTFESIKANLAKILEEFTVQIEHIGSTAIPNALTKPVLDIVIIAKSLENQEKIAPLLTQSGYAQGELDKKQTKLFFSKPLQKDNNNEFLNYIHLHLAYKNTTNVNDTISIKIRDYLLHHPEEVQIYNSEKIRLAELGNYDRSFYVSHKESYIKTLIKKLVPNQ